MAIKKKKIVSNKKTKVENTIYIQIAAYRDPELIKTIEDCIEHARYPKNLRFGIAWQHSSQDTWDTLDKYKDDKRFRIIDIDYQDAKGVCHARSLLNDLYDGEKYTLQLDSHHRFIQDWDAHLIQMLEGLRKKGHKKPLLTAYLPDFFPNSYSEQSRSIIPWRMAFDRFFPEGVVFVRPESIDDYRERTEPVPSRFLSAHFIFTDGKFCKEIPYDSTFYFHGEEPDLAVRSYMAGYDLFHPHYVIVWHEYTRNGKVKQWDDDKQWVDRNLKSYEHFRTRYGMDPNKIDGKHNFMINTKIVRSLRDYERYAGIDFENRRIHKAVLDRTYPPSAHTEEEFVNGLQHYQKICIDINRKELTETDYNILVVVLLDKHGNEIYRQDSGPDEFQPIINSNPGSDGIQIWRTMYASEWVTGWMVWPHSVSKGWMPQIKGSFTTE